MPKPGQRADVASAHVDHREITFYGGIGSARVTAWADALDTTPEAIIRAADVVPPIMDTAKQKNHKQKERKQKERKKRDRATAPHLRCMAWATHDLPEVRAVLETSALET